VVDVLRAARPSSTGFLVLGRASDGHAPAAQADSKFRKIPHLCRVSDARIIVIVNFYFNLTIIFDVLQKKFQKHKQQKIK
jgi:hypothetical protein